MMEQESPRIKICGLRDPENIEDILSLRPDYVGFIFDPKSARFVGGKLPVSVARDIEDAKKVGVFVDAEYAEIEDAINQYELDVIQLHGDESPELCAKIRNYGVDVIKAFAVGESFDFKQLVPYRRVVDFYLFDAKGEKPGGNGTTFNWRLLEKYDGKKPFFLSGGIGPEHAEEILNLTLPGLIGLDLNSKFEEKPGVKDFTKLDEFFEAVRPADYWE